MNDNFFENINDENSAYFVGFLLADGSIGKSDNRIRLQLQSQDIDILEKIKKCIDIDNEILFRNIKEKSYCGLSITNKKLKKDLISIGITPNKTQSCQYPNIKDNLFWHFLRGLSDGDGCIYFSNSKKIASWSLVCHMNIVEILKYKIEYETDIHVTVQDHWRTPYIKCLSINGNQNVYLFLKKLYENSFMFLDRKYNKYIIFKTFYEDFLKSILKVKPIGIEKTKGGKYVARIKYHNKRQYIGCFLNSKDATDAYDKKLIELHGKNCITNKMIENF